jgi:hypothetical protein
MGNRDFRTPESYKFETETRGMLKNFLEERGFRKVNDIRKQFGNTQSQTIHAVTPNGKPAVMRVRLCWRHTGKAPHENAHSAAQLRARVLNDNWEGTLQTLVERARADGVTHFLIVQREYNKIIYAALIPCSELISIWCSQRDISSSLIAKRKLGRRKKNHAMNGASPTLWLKDDQAPDVTAALWNHAGVKDLAKLNIVTKATQGKFLEAKPINGGTRLPLKDENDIESLQVARTIVGKRLHNKLTNKLRVCLTEYILLEGDNKRSMFDVLVKNHNGKDMDLLIEVKSSIEAAHIRMAVGQLFDYWFSIYGETRPHLAILLPNAPREEIKRLLDWLKIGVLWFSKNELQTCTDWLHDIAKEPKTRKLYVS